MELNKHNITNQPDTTQPEQPITLPEGATIQENRDEVSIKLPSGEEFNLASTSITIDGLCKLALDLREDLLKQNNIRPKRTGGGLCG